MAGTGGFTGVWILNKDLSESVRQEKGFNTKADMLKEMGRNRFEISVIDKADERFRLIHFKKPGAKNTIHVFDKHVRIYLDSKVLKTVASITNWLSIGIKPIDQVQYSNTLYTGYLQEHPNDEKRFGACKTVTSFDEGLKTFTIRWYLQGPDNARVLLRVSHQIVTVENQDKLQVIMEYFGTRNPEKDAPLCRSVKLYDRSPMEGGDLVYRDKHKYRQYLAES